MTTLLLIALGALISHRVGHNRGYVRGVNDLSKTICAQYGGETVKIKEPK